MEMKVHLHPDVFDIVKKGTKDIEARVNDEKRRQLKVGDTLLFLKRPLEDESLRAKVIGLHYFNTFEEMGAAYDFKRLYLESYNLDMWLKELAKFYSKEEIAEYGVVAIEFSLLDEEN